ncbi:hypothetical protein OG735_33540 [Streptomyces sp. NBC_01210]|uniref:hypothetical protein n=1 Tax=Streptomyces sp. NBC_01210 TaxID=2903774 RepID=UPI002E142CF8|nr:hypothetical protein OG735_33540 [Streptomyces sp. NBC_01210]
MSVAAIGAAVLTPVLVTHASAASEFCVSGTLKYTHVDAEAGGRSTTNPARGSEWELWGNDGSDKKLTSGTIADNGSFNACHRPARGSSLTKVRVQFFARGNGANVVTDVSPYATGYSFETRSASAITRDLGDVMVPSAAGAWKIVDTFKELSSKTAKANGTKYVWPTAIAQAPFFDTINTYAVFLKEDDTRSKHLILHEAGHSLQYKAQGKWWDSSKNLCPKGHRFGEVLSPECAFTEGFGDAVAAHALGDAKYVHPSGTVVSLRPPSAGSNWTTQDDVAGALVARWNTDGKFRSDLNAFSGQLVDTYAQFFSLAGGAPRP